MAQTAKLISTDELRTMSSEEYMVTDIRGKYSYSFGHIDGAVLVSSKLSDEELSAQLASDCRLLNYTSAQSFPYSFCGKAKVR